MNSKYIIKMLKNENTKLDDFINTISTWFHNLSIIKMYYSTKLFIYNTYKFRRSLAAPHWDYSGVYKILADKLSLMYDELSGDTFGEVKALKKLRVAKLLAERLAKEEYLENANMFFDEKYPNYTKVMLTDLISNHKGLDIPNEKYNEYKKLKNTKYRIYDKSDLQKEQDRIMLFNILSRYIEMWWD